MTAGNPAGPTAGGVAAGTSYSVEDALFSRRIEFHSPVKPSLPAANAASGLESLNPDPERPVPPAAMSAAEPLYENSLDPVLSLRITFRKIGAGLENLGNTCFLNSVLQCLTYTEPFAAYLQSGRHKYSCKNTDGFCTMCALQNHVMVALHSSGKILKPLHLVNNLSCISRNFGNSSQEDAHEYMVNLLEAMHKCCIPSGVPIESPGAYEKSLVHKIFGGRLRSQVKCMQCSYSSNKFEPFLDLSLEIVKADSLRKALFDFVAVEQLDGGEKQYQCQRCKDKVRALKQLTIHKAPYVLTIHLKRFDSYVLGKKVNRRVDFEPTLDLKPFVSDPHERDLKYTLYGVIVHSGSSIHSGHYYCYVRTSSGMWYSLDDMEVSQVSEKTVLAQKAYMLFYVRNRSSFLKKSEVVHKDSFPTNASGDKVVSLSARLSSVVVQTCNERNLPNTGNSSTNLRIHVGSSMDPSSLMKTLSNGPLKKSTSLQKNEKVIPNGAPLSQDSSQNIAGGTACSQVNGNALSVEFKQATAEAGKFSVVPRMLGRIIQPSMMQDPTTPAEKSGSVSAVGHKNEALGSGALVSQNNMQNIAGETTYIQVNGNALLEEFKQATTEAGTISEVPRMLLGGTVKHSRMQGSTTTAETNDSDSAVRHEIEPLGSRANISRTSSQNIAEETTSSQVYGNSFFVELKQVTAEAVTISEVPNILGGTVQHSVIQDSTTPAENNDSVSATRHKNEALDSHSTTPGENDDSASPARHKKEALASYSATPAENDDSYLSATRYKNVAPGNHSATTCENDDSVYAAKHKNYTLDALGNGNFSIGKCPLFDNLNMEKSRIINSNATNLAFENACENAAKKSLKEKHLNKNDNVVDENVHNSKLCKMVSDDGHTESGADSVVSQPGSENVWAQKEASATAPTSHESVRHKNERDPCNPLSFKKSFSKPDDFRKNNFSDRQSSADSLVQKKVPGKSGKAHPATVRKIKKFAECPTKSLYFGRSHLLCSCVVLINKFKKHRSKRRGRRSMGLLKVGFINDNELSEQSTSTYETFGNVLVVSERSFKKCSRSRSKAENSNLRGKRRKGSNHGAVNIANKGVEVIGISTSELPVTDENPSTSQCKSKEQNSNNMSLHHDDFMNLLTRGLKRVAVAQWDDLEFPNAERDALEDSLGSIGYVLDEWDEEYYCGKNKKIKKI